MSRAAEFGRVLEALIEEKVREAVEPLRLEIERLRGAASDGMLRQDEAAARLGVERRTIQRWLRDGRLEAVPVGGVRMVRWPPRVPPRP